MIVAFPVLVVGLASGFAFLNGFRDVSNAVALSTRTRALTPSVAVLGSCFQLHRRHAQRQLRARVHAVWITLPNGIGGLSMLTSALAASIIWGVYAWWRGIPLSSTNSLVGGLIGAGAASALVGGNSINGVDNVLLTRWRCLWSCPL